jgi:hypothetical protein
MIYWNDFDTLRDFKWLKAIFVPTVKSKFYYAMRGESV